MNIWIDRRQPRLRDLAEACGDCPATARRIAAIDWDELFVSLSLAYGWTPEQIARLTLRQLATYARAVHGEAASSRRWVSPAEAQLRSLHSQPRKGDRQ